MARGKARHTKQHEARVTHQRTRTKQRATRERYQHNTDKDRFARRVRLTLGLAVVFADDVELGRQSLHMPANNITVSRRSADVESIQR
jgi:hypothetical protein